MKQKQTFSVSGMTCAACQASVQKAVAAVPGVDSIQVNLLTNSMTVVYTPGLEKTIIHEVQEAGYDAAIKTETSAASLQQQKKKTRLYMQRRLVVSFVFLLPLMVISMGPMLGLNFPDGFMNPFVNLTLQWILTIPILWFNRRYFTVGLKRLLQRDPNMDSLVALGTGAAIIYGFYITVIAWLGQLYGDMIQVMSYMNQLYLESAGTILALVTLGKYLEELSKQKTLGALEKLMDLTPKKALKQQNDQWIEVDVSSLKVNDMVRVLPGTIVPLDGVIIRGQTSINQAAITGESIPVEKVEGDKVIGATLNQYGSIDVEITHIGGETTLSKIIALVEEASQSKAPLAKLADTVAGIFVPIVIAIALSAFGLWLLLGEPLTFALQIMISILVISCPCALGLATPVAMMVGTGKGAELGILIKSAEAVEKLANIDTVVLDKTGTITQGTPRVETILCEDGIDEAFLLTVAASVESQSEHPLAKAIVQTASERKFTLKEVDSFVMVPGVGVRGVIEGTTYRFGKINAMEDARLTPYLAQGKTIIQGSTKEKILGYFVLSDTIKSTSKNAINALHHLGLKVVMLTGDLAPVAASLAQEMNIDDVHANVLPDQKDAHIQTLQHEGKKVVMVGDGINDAPSLMRADVGLAIGSGTDIAIESADMVLLQSDLFQIVHAIYLAKKVVTNMKVNLFWAFIYNVIAIPLAAGVLYPFTGWLLSPMIAAGAMALSSISVVLNALRLRSFHPTRYNERR
jgi:Cu+-exporting ATPase